MLLNDSTKWSSDVWVVTQTAMQKKCNIIVQGDAERWAKNDKKIRKIKRKLAKS